jgi:hypothetical protein
MKQSEDERTSRLLEKQHMLRQVCLVGFYSVVSQLTTARAAIVDVSQTAYQGVADLSRGDRSGQTFTATRNGLLAGVRLYAQGASWGPSYPAGSDLTVRLRSLGPNGVPTETPLAVGFLPRSAFDREIPKWVTIWFDSAYSQSAGEKLAFMVECATSGSEGWIDFGMRNGDPYPAGQQFHLDFFDGFATPALSVSNMDFAFQTLLVPEPARAIYLIAVASLLWRTRLVR